MALFRLYLCIAVAVLLQFPCSFTTVETQWVSAAWEQQRLLRLEGNTQVTLTCLLTNVNVTNAVNIRRNDIEITPIIQLQPLQNYVHQEFPRYFITITHYTTYAILQLDITNVSRHDDGYYVCQILNSTKEAADVLAYSDPLVFTVYYLPEGLPTCSPTEEVSVVASKNVTLTCTLQVGKPMIRFKWWYQNQFIDGITTVTKDIATSTLTVTPSSEAEIYSHRCLVSLNSTTFEDAKPRECLTGRINVITSLEVIVTPPSLTVSPGDDAIFTCNISSDIMAKRFWSVENILSAEGKLFLSGDKEEDLLIQNVQPGEGGQVTCRVFPGGSLSVVSSSSVLIIKDNQTNITTGITPTRSMSSFMNKGTSTSGLSSTAVMGIAVGSSIIVLVAVITVLIFIAKSRGKQQPPSDKELQSTSPKKKLSGPVIYADLDLTDMPHDTEVRPPTEEATVYASVKP